MNEIFQAQRAHEREWKRRTTLLQAEGRQYSSQTLPSGRIANMIRRICFTCLSEFEIERYKPVMYCFPCRSAGWPLVKAPNGSLAIRECDKLNDLLIAIIALGYASEWEESQEDGRMTYLLK